MKAILILIAASIVQSAETRSPSYVEIGNGTRKPVPYVEISKKVIENKQLVSERYKKIVESDKKEEVLRASWGEKWSKQKKLEKESREKIQKTYDERNGFHKSKEHALERIKKDLEQERSKDRLVKSMNQDVALKREQERNKREQTLRMKTDKNFFESENRKEAEKWFEDNLIKRKGNVEQIRKSLVAELSQAERALKSMSDNASDKWNIRKYVAVLQLKKELLDESFPVQVRGPVITLNTPEIANGRFVDGRR